MEKCAVIVNTCDQNMDLLDNFFYLFHRFWANLCRCQDLAHIFILFIFFLLRKWCNEHWLNVIFCSLGGVIIPLGVAYLVNKTNLKWIKKVFGE